MIDINDIKIEDLQDSSRFNEFQAAVVEAVEDDRARDVLDFRLKIQQFFREFADLETSNSDLFKNYRKIILYIELELFELLPEDLQVVILEKYFTSFEKLKLDVGRKVELAVLLTEDVLQNDKRDTFMAALLKSQQRVGSQPIEVQGKMVPPTLGNWVAKYRFKYGLAPKDELTQMDFCTRDEARNLSDQDRAQLQKVIECVESVKIQPEKDEREEREASKQAPKKQKYSSGLFALDVPVKKPKVPMSEVQKLYSQPTTSKPSVAPGAEAAQNAAMNHSEATNQQPAARGFHSLADLNTLDATFFQSLGQQLPQFVAQVQAEVQKVYTRSPESRTHIIDLWRQSPVYHLYYEMSEDSMNTQQPIEQVAKMRQQSGKSTLSAEEFYQVASLSKAIQ